MRAFLLRALGFAMIAVIAFGGPDAIAARRKASSRKTTKPNAPAVKPQPPKPDPTKTEPPKESNPPKPESTKPHAAAKERTTEPVTNLGKLAADLQLIHSKSAVTPEQKQQLAADLMASAQGTAKPSWDGVYALACDISKTKADGKIEKPEQAKLAEQISKVLNSANIPAADVDAVIKDVQTILAAGGVTKIDAQIIANDLMAIAAEMKKPPAPP